MTCLFNRKRMMQLLGLLAGCLASAVVAQTYPDRPIKMLVGFPPGGGVDIAARTLGAEMQRLLGQPVTIENRTGAAGNLATEAATKAAPDGYTLLMGNAGSLAINPALYSKLSFDVLRDLTPVGMVSSSPLLVLVHPQHANKNLAELIAQAKKTPNRLSFGTGGSGSVSHLSFELFKAQANIQMTHVPYRGGSPAITDLLAGQLDVVIEGVPIATGFLATQRLRALATTSKNRLPNHPDIPTTAELGFPDFSAQAWYGVMAPAGTPAAVVQRLNTVINAVLKQPEFKEKLAQQGYEPLGGTPAQFTEFLQRESPRWVQAVKLSGAKVD